MAREIVTSENREEYINKKMNPNAEKEKYKPGWNDTKEPTEAEIITKNKKKYLMKREFKGKYSAFDDEGNKLGSVSYHPTNLDGYHANVYIEPEHRRQGIASAMYDHIEKHIIKKPFQQGGGQSEMGRLFRKNRDIEKNKK